MEDQIAVNQGNFEFLVGLDTCSYRMACKSVLGDRDLSITQKRYQAKVHLMDLYKEQYEAIAAKDGATSTTAATATQTPTQKAKLAQSATKEESKASIKTKAATARRSSGSGSIFDLDDSIQKPPPDEAASKDAFAEEARNNFTAKQSLDLAKLKSAIASISEKKPTDADGTEDG